MTRQRLPSVSAWVGFIENTFTLLGLDVANFSPDRVTDADVARYDGIFDEHDSPAVAGDSYPSNVVKEINKYPSNSRYQRYSNPGNKMLVTQLSMLQKLHALLVAPEVSEADKYTALSDLLVGGYYDNREGLPCLFSSDNRFLGKGPLRHVVKEAFGFENEWVLTAGRFDYFLAPDQFYVLKLNKVMFDANTLPLTEVFPEHVPDLGAAADALQAALQTPIESELSAEGKGHLLSKQQELSNGLHTKLGNGEQMNPAHANFLMKVDGDTPLEELRLYLRSSLEDMSKLIVAKVLTDYADGEKALLQQWKRTGLTVDASTHTVLYTVSEFIKRLGNIKRAAIDDQQAIDLIEEIECHYAPLFNGRVRPTGYFQGMSLEPQYMSLGLRSRLRERLDQTDECGRVNIDGKDLLPTPMSADLKAKLDARDSGTEMQKRVKTLYDNFLAGQGRVARDEFRDVDINAPVFTEVELKHRLQAMLHSLILHFTQSTSWAHNPTMKDAFTELERRLCEGFVDKNALMRMVVKELHEALRSHNAHVTWYNTPSARKVDGDNQPPEHRDEASAELESAYDALMSKIEALRGTREATLTEFVGISSGMRVMQQDVTSLVGLRFSNMQAIDNAQLNTSMTTDTKALLMDAGLSIVNGPVVASSPIVPINAQQVITDIRATQDRHVSAAGGYRQYIVAAPGPVESVVSATYAYQHAVPTERDAAAIELQGAVSALPKQFFGPNRAAKTLDQTGLVHHRGMVTSVIRGLALAGAKIANAVSGSGYQTLPTHGGQATSSTPLLQASGSGAVVKNPTFDEDAASAQ